METITVNSPSIEAIYKRTGEGSTIMNPGREVPDLEKYSFFDYRRIFYIVRCPTTCKGYKLGRAYDRVAGGARLREYFSRYGYGKGFHVHMIILFKGRPAHLGGQATKSGSRPWAESKFEQRVKKLLTERKIEPIRASEYFLKLEDVMSAVNEILKTFTFEPTVNRRSKRIPANLKNIKEKRNEEYVRAVPGDVIEYRWNVDGFQDNYRGTIVEFLSQKEEEKLKDRYSVDFSGEIGVVSLPKKNFRLTSENLTEKNTFKYIKKTSKTKAEREKFGLTLEEIAENRKKEESLRKRKRTLELKRKAKQKKQRETIVLDDTDDDDDDEVEVLTKRVRAVQKKRDRNVISDKRMRAVQKKMQTRLQRQIAAQPLTRNRRRRIGVTV